MTQQYYPPQYPQQPAFQPPVQQGPPEWAQPQGQPQWQPPVQQQFQSPQAPPALANGGLDEFYGQPSLGGGPGISWKGKPDGYTVQGVVPRDVTDADVSQEVGAPNTAEAGKPQFYRDGRPKFVMAVPLQVAQSPEFPDGEARLYVRGQLRDELARAMAEAGASGAPAAGSVITVTLAERKHGRGAIPQNIFRVAYTPAGGQAPQVAQHQQAQAPVQQQPQYAAPAPQQAPVQQFQPQVQYQQPVQQAPVQQQVPGGTSPAAGYPQQGQQAPVQQHAPVQQQAPAQAPQQSAPPAPAGLSPEQQQLLAQLNGQQG